MKFYCVVLSILFAIAVLQVRAQVESVVKNRVDSLMKEMSKTDNFSGIVLLAKEGKLFYQKTGGFKDWQTQTPGDEKTVFNIGSITKRFTEELIHQLVKEGKLNYDDPVSKYLDIFPKTTGSKITIQHLLDMKSGLGDYTGNRDFEKIRFTNYQVSDLLNIIKHESPEFEPGTNRSYSNSGFVVLGGVIEKITGTSYSENLKIRIAQPLNMTVYYSRDEKLAVQNRATGTSIRLDGKKKTIDEVTSASPAGGIYLNATDLLLFQEAIRLAKTPSGKSYPRGMVAGGNPYWNSNIGSSNDYSVVVLTNTGDVAEQVGERIYAILKDRKLNPIAKPIEVQFFALYNEKGIDYIEKNFGDIVKNFGRQYSPMFINYYGFIILSNDRSDVAIELFKMNTRLFPNDASSFDGLAEAYFRMGDQENAKIFTKKALEINPNYEYAKKRMEQL